MKNGSIKCLVEECKYNTHAKYFTLKQIQVGTNEPHPKKIECANCESFAVDNYWNKKLALYICWLFLVNDEKFDSHSYK